MEQARGLMAQTITAVTALLQENRLTTASRTELLDFAIDAGALLRTTQAALIVTTAEAEERSASPSGEQRFDVACGCRNVNELMQRTTGAAPATIKNWSRLGKLVREDLAMTGDRRPARFPALRDALLTGRIGADGLAAATVPLDQIRDRVPADHLALADQALADVAGTDDDDIVLAEQAAGAGDWGAPATDEPPTLARRSVPVMSDTLRVHAGAWATALDQDGAEPQDERASRLRSLYFGIARDGIVPIRGNLLPEVAAQLQTVIDAITNPHGKDKGVRFRETDEPVVHDDRTIGQRAHDALAAALTVAASSDLSIIGGAAPTLVVHVKQADLASGTGWGHVTGADATGTNVPVSVAVATHTACVGQIQRVVTGKNGRVLATTIADRIFNATQRRAIIARDHTCIIPGCHTPARWCEFHHVTEWHDGGPTSIDNGVLLCWNHHRYLDTNGWAIRIVDGVPEVRAPHWYDQTHSWHPTRPPAPKLPSRIPART